MSTVAPGVYRHWKGNHYRVLFTAWDSNNESPREEVVVYVSLSRGIVNVRRVREFTEMVPSGDGGVVPRFVAVEFP